MRVLVTGSTGLVGNNLVRILRDEGHKVRALTRRQSSSRPLEGLDIELALGDVRDADSVEAAVSNVDLVIHSAAMVRMGRRNLSELHDVNVEGTRHVAVAARKASVRMVHVSSVDAVGVSPSNSEPVDEETAVSPPTKLPYVLTKREAESVVADEIEKGLDAVIVNPGFMFGPWDWKPSSGRLLLEVARGRIVLAPRGSISLCDVRDVARGIVSAAERGQGGQRYVLAGTLFSYLEACRLFAEVTGGRRPWFAMGPLITRAVGRAGDFWGAVTRTDPEVNLPALHWASEANNFSSRRAEAELGYRNRPAHETVEEAWAWLQDYGYVG